MPWAIQRFAFEPDAFVHELVDSILGDNYMPSTACSCTTNASCTMPLLWAMCGDPRPAGRFDLYAVEGHGRHVLPVQVPQGEPALNPGDTIAMVTPIFTPYLEMPHLEDYGLHFITIAARQDQRRVHRPRPGAAPRLGEGVLRRGPGNPTRSRSAGVDRRRRARARRNGPTSSS